MSRMSARRVFWTCALSALLAVFALPAVASAAKKKGVNKAKCSSELAIKGEGSSAQKAAQQNDWIPGFEKSATNKAACSGTQGSGAKPKVTYAPEGSGAGLKAFGAEGEPVFHGKTVQYAGTDEAPNEGQKNEIEAHSAGIVQKPVLATIPVAVFAEANIIHLPEGCTANSKEAPGRLSLSNAALSEFWLGHIKTWGELISFEHTENPGAEDTITPESCLADEITHVVRLDQSGTTHTFKKYLGIISKEKVPFEGPISPADWDETAEGKENTDWPTADSVIRPLKKGGAELAALVANTPSSIGYVNLAEARANLAFIKTSEGGTAGPGSTTFWAVLQNSGTATETKSGKKQKYADPSTNGEMKALANSNCEGEKFTNGTGTKFPPKSVFDTWNNVTSETKQKKYTLCGLTYDLAVSYALKFTEAPEEGQPTTVINFLEYVLNDEAEGGQKKLEEPSDFFSIGKLDKEAVKGLGEVFEKEIATEV